MQSLASINSLSLLCSSLNRFRNPCVEVKSVILAVAALGGMFAFVNSAFAQTWTKTSAPQVGWTSIASSADGTKLVAVGGYGICTSPDSGATWIINNVTNALWCSVACSSNGTRLVAVAYSSLDYLPGFIYTSANFGTTWTQTGPTTNYWMSVACSSDGSHFVAASYGGSIYTAIYSGAIWTQTSTPQLGWESVASSSDGTKLAAAAWDGGIYTSTNSGTTWTQTSAPISEWACIASSSDGTKLVAVEGTDTGGIYISANSGRTWTQKNAPQGGWQSVASSSDRTKLVAVGPGGIYTSPDSGEVWIQNSPTDGGWWAVTSSADGTRLAVAQYSGGIYTYASPLAITVQPTNQTAQCGANATFSVTAVGTSPLSYQWYYGTNPLTDNSLISGSSSTSLTLSDVSISQAGTYTVVVTNAYSNMSSHPATLFVADTNAPVLTLNGNANMIVECHTGFTDPGATATDACVGSLALTTNGTVDANSVGTYIISYVATNPSSYSETATRTVHIVDTTPPVITLIGAPTITISQYSAFTDPGATAYDTCAGTVPVTTNDPLLLTTLVSFAGTNGAYPAAALVQGTDGHFYGTTSEGGLNNDGTVFKITTNGTLTTLVSLAGTNGAYPQAALVEGADGKFYGTTLNGGANNEGTVFQITTNGTFTILVSFNGTNGRQPTSGLVHGSDGYFYGTTDTGGASAEGTVFKIATNGTLTNLISFNGGNGAYPASAAPLVQGSDGNFYGTTSGGGANNNSTVFKITTNGTLTTLVSFNGFLNDGALPNGVVQGTDGNLYGTTWAGGPYSKGPSGGGGTVFKVTTNGALTTLISFDNTDGANPSAALVQGNDGNFYGTTEEGGMNNDGTVFKITSNGTLTTLLSFNDSNGAYPEAALVQGSDGNFYGTTPNGGANNDGTVFQMTTGSIHVNTPGIFLINYVASDPSGNSATNSRTVVVLPCPPPVFQTVAQTNQTVTLVWSTVAGQTYQLQYKTNLALPNWNNLGCPLVATNGVITMSDTTCSDTQRFYRVVQSQ